MNLSQFGLLADENIHPSVVAWLREQGFDVTTVGGTDRSGADDTRVIELACSQERVILTHDADFGKLSVAEKRPLFGMVFLRPGHIDPIFTIETIRTLLAQPQAVRPPFIVVAKRAGGLVTVRVRQLT